MKSAIVLSALTIVGIEAQGSPPKDPAAAAAAGAKGGNSGIMSALGQLYGKDGVPFGPAPKGCSAYEVLFARGTFEPGPFGSIIGDPLMNAIKKEMAGEDVRGYAVQYPAKMGGADIGTKDVVDRVTNQSKDCPKQQFALVGYSQGGMVVSAAAPKIPQDLRSKVVAMVLYGAGKGDSAGKGGGPPPSSDIKAMTLANCAPGDNCGTPADGQTAFTGHLSYANQGTVWHPRSAKYIANAFHGKPQGYKLELVPT